MTKKIVKLAVIRRDTEDACPFGLSITIGCENAGDLVDKMAPVNVMGEDSTEEEKQAIQAANNHLLKWQSPGTTCKYASKIIKNKEAVECEFGEDNIQHSGNGSALVGSPWYYKDLSGVGLDGLYTFPRGVYTDVSIDNGQHYYGQYSIESIAGTENIKCSRCGVAFGEQCKPGCKS